MDPRDACETCEDKHDCCSPHHPDPLDEADEVERSLMSDRDPEDGRTDY